MSEEELEQDELDGADEDDGEELAAADDGEADSSDGDEAPAPGKKAKAAVVEEELPSVEAKQKERDALAKASAMAPAILAGIPPRRIPVGEPIFRLFRHGWRRAKAFSFPVAALPFHIVNRSCLPSRRSKRRPGPILHLPESEL